MKLLWVLIICLCGVLIQPETIEPGPASGIVLKDQQGLLITNCRVHTQRVFVKLNPREVFRKHLKGIFDLVPKYPLLDWVRDILNHAEADTTHMLAQLQKFTDTQSELSGFKQRPKRFIGTLLTAAAAIGSLFSIGLSSVNTVSLSSVRRQVVELQAEIPYLNDQIARQEQQLETIGKTLRGTITIVNTHTVVLNKTYAAINKLMTIVQRDFAQAQIVTLLMSDLLQEVSSSVDSLARGQIPSYLVPLSLVQSILQDATGSTTEIQSHLAYSLGSAVPIYVHPKAREVAFLLNLPIIKPENVYRLKDVVNVGFWRGNLHVKIHTPPVVAYHDYDPKLYLAPNLLMCTLTKDIHYLCPSKPFVKDSTGGICGLQPLSDNAKCPTTVKPRYEVTTTSAEIVDHRWLVSTPARVATLSYSQHDTNSRLDLPEQTVWIEVPDNAILHLDDLSLYHLPAIQYETEIEIPDFFGEHEVELNSRTVERIEYEGSQLIDLGPIDKVLTDIQTFRKTPLQNLSYAWSTADSILATFLVLQSALLILVIIIFVRRVRGLQTQINNCKIRAPAIFKRRTERNTSLPGPLDPLTLDDHPSSIMTPPKS